MMIPAEAGWFLLCLFCIARTSLEASGVSGDTCETGRKAVVAESSGDQQEQQSLQGPYPQ